MYTYTLCSVDALQEAMMCRKIYITYYKACFFL